MKKYFTPINNCLPALLNCIQGESFSLLDSWLRSSPESRRFCQTREAGYHSHSVVSSAASPRQITLKLNIYGQTDHTPSCWIFITFTLLLLSRHNSIKVNNSSLLYTDPTSEKNHFYTLTQGAKKITWGNLQVKYTFQAFLLMRYGQCF